MSQASSETPAPTAATAALMARRFRSYLPVAIDVETGGFHPATDALLEIAAVLIDMAEDGSLKRGATHDFHVQPFAGARLDPTALAKAVTVAGLEWDPGSAHNARYDAERSADVFCLVCNRLRDSHQAAEERARALGWWSAAAEPAPEEPDAQEPPLETDFPSP